MAERPLNRDRDPELSPYTAGRRGPERRDRFFSRSELEQIRRTVSRAPEVMVKVTGGGTSRSAVAAHLRYITRDGTVRGETDQGSELMHPEDRSEFLRELRLDLARGQHRGANGRGAPWEGRKPPKVAYHIVLAMPISTPPAAVLKGARQFARENFALKHRYALVLHTDPANPHVHIVVKAEDLSGRRLRIDKAKLRDWRVQFAAAMRAQGVDANASSRFERGRNKRHPFRQSLVTIRRDRSRVLRRMFRDVEDELIKSHKVSDPAHAKLERTRAVLRHAWDAIVTRLDAQGESHLAADVRLFVSNLPKVQTEREAIAAHLIERQRTHPRQATETGERIRERERQRELELTR